MNQKLNCFTKGETGEYTKYLDLLYLLQCHYKSKDFA